MHAGIQAGLDGPQTTFERGLRPFLVAFILVQFKPCPLKQMVT